MNQTQYISDLQHMFHMQNSATCPTPIAVGTTLSKTDSELFSDPVIYRSVIGALQYVMQTKTYTSYVVNKLSQFLQTPYVNNWKVVKRPFTYLQGTKTHGISLKFFPTLQLYG